jgi:hypothetical protein
MVVKDMVESNCGQVLAWGSSANMLSSFHTLVSFLRGPHDNGNREFK